MKLRILLWINLLFLSIIFFTSSVNAQTPLTSCGTISSPGNYYLANNVSNSGTCFTINSNNVYLNCQGNIINYSQPFSPPFSYGIYASTINNLTVENCVVHKDSGSYGIYLLNVSNSNIMNNIINASPSLYVFRGYNNNISYNNLISPAALIQDSSNITLLLNIISAGDPYFGYGLYLGQNNNLKIINNIINATPSYNIYLVGYLPIHFIHIIQNNTGNGKPILYFNQNNQIIDLSNQQVNSIIVAVSNNLTIRNANVSGEGFRLFYTNSTIIKNSIIKNSKRVNGIDLWHSQRNTIHLNNISTSIYSNTGDISFFESSNNLIISNNITSYGDENYGVSSSQGINNSVLSNRISTRGYGTTGIIFYNITKSTIKDNIMYIAQNFPLNPFGSTSIALSYGNNNNITSNNISLLSYPGSYPGSGGISIGESFNNNIVLNNITFLGSGSSGSTAISVYIGSGNILANDIDMNVGWSGINIVLSSNFTIAHNKIKAKHPYGNTIMIRFYSSGYNLVYNNLINTSANPSINFGGVILANSWNTTLQPGPNIVNGPYIGGNFYARLNGSGFSQTCSDNNQDGICDVPLNHAPNNIDYLPLAKPPNITVEQLPVILVHGYSAEPDSTWATMKQRLEQDGFNVYAIALQQHPYNPNETAPANGDIINYANVLKNYIYDVKSLTGASKVDIVAHSMGGLVSRWYIQKPDYQGDVRKLIMLGTPNHGSELFDFFLPLLDLWGCSFPKWAEIFGFSCVALLGDAAQQMRTNSKFLNSLNYGIGTAGDFSYLTDINSSAVPYFTMAGTKGGVGIILSGYIGASSVFCPFSSSILPGIDDCIVSVDSVSLDFVSSLMLYLNHYELHDDIISYNFVKALLLSNIIPIVSQVSQQQNETSPFSIIALLNNSINPGELVNHTIQIDNTISQAMIILSWTNGSLNLTLTDPIGGIFNSSSSDPNVLYFSDANMSTQGFLLNLPMQGLWAINVDGAYLNSIEKYVVFVFGNTTLKIEGLTDVASIMPSQNVVIGARISDDNINVTGANVIAKVLRPDNLTDIINLHDDGLHNDWLANDGFYANIYNNTGNFGSYNVYINATGSYAGGFSRYIMINFFVELPSDLEIRSSDILFSPIQLIPGQNQSVNVTATIHNIGQTDADNVTINFYDGNPMNNGTLFANQTISVPVTSSVNVSILFNYVFNPTPELSVEQNQNISSLFNINISDKGFKNKDIYVIISSFSNFIELNYSNNIAHKELDIQDTHYILAMSLGTSPGITLSDNRTIPLNYDAVFDLSVFFPSFVGLQNSTGILDNNGEALAQWSVPAFAPPGITVYFGFVTLNPLLNIPASILSISYPVNATTP